MIYHTFWVGISVSSVWKLFELGCLHQHTVTDLSLYRLNRTGTLVKFLRILMTVVYFKDWQWISKSVICLTFSVVCKIAFCSKFPDIPVNTGGATRKRREKTQAIAKRYAFHANAVQNWCFFENVLHVRVFKFSILTTNNAIDFFHLNLFVYRKCFLIILLFFSYSLGENKFI